MPHLVNPNPTVKQLSLFDLEKLEKRIAEGLAKFIDVGQALAEIQAREGYKLRGHKTFEEYCDRQFGFSLRHGQRLIAAAETAQKVQQITGGDAPKNEATARVLAGIAKDEKIVKRVEAELKKSKKTFATATAEKIAEVVERVTGRSKVDNGKASSPAPQPTLFVATDPSKAAHSATRDECPNCHTTPDRYVHLGESWHCGHCDHIVAISIAIAVVVSRCAKCNAIVGTSDDFCNTCGEVL